MKEELEEHKGLQLLTRVTICLGRKSFPFNFSQFLSKMSYTIANSLSPSFKHLVPHRTKPPKSTFSSKMTLDWFYKAQVKSP